MASEASFIFILSEQKPAKDASKMQVLRCYWFAKQD